ncbi:MAG: FAD:protein FMN transferase [Oscillospiraceae bacterium]
MKTERWRVVLLGGLLAAACVALGLVAWRMAGRGAPAAPQDAEPSTNIGFAMDTVVDQQAYGPNANEAMQAVNQRFAEYEKRLSLFEADSDIAKINAAAGKAGAEVAPETAALIEQALRLSREGQGAFAVSIAPLTLAWGITGAAPRVLAQSESDALLTLVDDDAVAVDGTCVTLGKAGMGLDLGGIAKGAACSVAKAAYDEHGVASALLSIGGNVYAHGCRPDGSPFRIGFRDPVGGGYIASFQLADAVVAVSGGYERYFEADGVRYIHILDARSGRPAESDIVSVGALDADGAVADFWSTTLFVLGREKALEAMRAGRCALFLDDAGTLYVSESLRDGFALRDEAQGVTVEFVPGA